MGTSHFGLTHLVVIIDNVNTEQRKSNINHNLLFFFLREGVKNISKGSLLQGKGGRAMSISKVVGGRGSEIAKTCISKRIGNYHSLGKLS